MRNPLIAKLAVRSHSFALHLRQSSGMRVQRRAAVSGAQSEEAQNAQRVSRLPEHIVPQSSLCVRTVFVCSCVNNCFAERSEAKKFPPEKRGAAPPETATAKRGARQLLKSLYVAVCQSHRMPNGPRGLVTIHPMSALSPALVGLGVYKAR